MNVQLNMFDTGRRILTTVSDGATTFHQTSIRRMTIGKKSMVTLAQGVYGLANYDTVIKKSLLNGKVQYS
jgi:hypothetical protein